MALRDLIKLSAVRGLFSSNRGSTKASAALLPEELDELTRLGRVHLLANELDMASACFEKASALDPANAENHCLLGKMSLRRQEFADAEKHLLRYIDLRPESIEGLSLLASVYTAQGQHSKALPSFRRALALDPTLDSLRLEFADTLVTLQVRSEALDVINTRLETSPTWEAGLLQAGQLQCGLNQAAAAIDTLRTLITIAPSVASYWNALGQAYSANRQLTEALECFDKAIACAPKNSGHFLDAADTAQQLQQPDRAINYLEMAIAEQSGDYDLHFRLALLCLAQGRRVPARGHLEICVDIDPQRSDAYKTLCQLAIEDGDPDDAVHFGTLATHYDMNDWRTWHALGGAQIFAKKYADAIQSFLKALSIENSNPQIHFDLGTSYLKSFHFAEAATSYRNAARLSPSSLLVRNALALALRELGEYHEAIAILESVIKEKPDYPDALTNAGLLQSDLGHHAEAEALFVRALSLTPNDWEIQVNRALNFLANRDFERGWPEYESRLNTANHRVRPFTIPRWMGEDLRGKSILVVGEQGLGDELMFASCIPDLTRTAQKVLIECDPKLAPIFARSFDKAEVHARTTDQSINWLQNSPSIDVQIPIGSLPLHFRRNEGDFPTHTGYLKADSNRVHFWRKQLNMLGHRTNIGISWRGGARQTRQSLRSIELEALASVFDLDHVNLVNLQYGDSENDRSALIRKRQITVHQFPTAIEDYDDTAALVCALDLVVTVQTAIVHLAGALARPVWVLVPFSPEWRYGRQSREMAWYPSARLFRQQRSGCWEEPLGEIQSTLVKMFSDRC